MIDKAMTSSAPVVVVAVTRGGARLGRSIAVLLDRPTELHVAARFADDAGPSAVPFEGPLRERVEALFPRVGGLVFVLALGATVRLIAPLLADKRSDPAVLVVDEAGRHVIPVVGGHAGGANELAETVAAALGAEPILTTASDGLGLPAIDTLGQAQGWTLDVPREVVTRVSAAVVDGEPVAVYEDAGDPAPLDALPADWPRLATPDALTAWRGPALVVSDRILNWAPPRAAAHTSPDRSPDGPGNDAPEGPRHHAPAVPRAVTPPAVPADRVVYRPPTLVLGVGCSLGASADELEKLAREALREAGLAAGSVALVATINRRLTEPGVVELAARFGVPLRGFAADALAAVAEAPSPSAEVARHVGTPGVCEPAAILASAGGTLLVPKRKSAMGTVAIARRAVGAQSARRGHLALVSLGPGPLDLLTPRTRRTLLEAGTVIGYRAYLESLATIVSASALRPYELGQERERAAAAIALARTGQRVALVSSGDVGVYGMAGLVYELLGSTSEPLAVEVVPGVTAATAAAALLGAPLMLDFAAISLSDLLVPWEQIERRLVAAAEGDLVIALYNPASARRRRQIARAKDVLLRHRPPETPVGLVREAYRPEQSVRVVTLAELDDPAVDMKTVVIIGNAATVRVGDRLVTRRGYLGAADVTPGAYQSRQSAEALRGQA